MLLIKNQLTINVSYKAGQILRSFGTRENIYGMVLLLLRCKRNDK